MKRVLTVSAVATAVLLTSVAPAWAHVTVASQGAVRGGTDTTITFRVPTESDTQSTIGVKVAMPITTPIASVEVLAMPGWQVAEKSVKLAKPLKTDDGTISEAVSEVTWTAKAGYAIPPGSFGEFTVIAGLLPDTASLTFPTIQTYTGKTTVNWIQLPAAGVDADDLDHPAPVLTLATRGSTSSAGSAAASSGGASVSAAGPTTSSGSSATATTLSVIAIVLALAAAALAVLGLRRRGGAPGA